jgi:hypothetical protein
MNLLSTSAHSESEVCIKSVELLNNYVTVMHGQQN